MELKADWEKLKNSNEKVEITSDYFEDIRKLCWGWNHLSSQNRWGLYIKSTPPGEYFNWKRQRTDDPENNPYLAKGYYQGEYVYSEHKYKTAAGWVTEKRPFVCIRDYNDKKPPLYKARDKGWALVARHDIYCDFAANSCCYCFTRDHPNADNPLRYDGFAIWEAHKSLPPQLNRYTQRKWDNGHALQPADLRFGKDAPEPVEFNASYITGSIGALYPVHRDRNHYPPDLKPEMPYSWNYYKHRGIPGGAEDYGERGSKSYAVDWKLDAYQSYLESLLDEIGQTLAAESENPEVTEERYIPLAYWYDEISLYNLGHNNSAFEYILANSGEYDWYLSKEPCEPREYRYSLLEGEERSDYQFEAVWRVTWRYSFGYPSKAYIDPKTGKPLIYPGWKGYPPNVEKHRFDTQTWGAGGMDWGYWNDKDRVNQSFQAAVNKLTDYDRRKTRENREPVCEDKYELFRPLLLNLYFTLTSKKQFGVNAQVASDQRQKALQPEDAPVTNYTDCYGDEQQEQTWELNAIWCSGDQRWAYRRFLNKDEVKENMQSKLSIRVNSYDWDDFEDLAYGSTAYLTIRQSSGGMANRAFKWYDGSDVEASVRVYGEMQDSGYYQHYDGKVWYHLPDTVPDGFTPALLGGSAEVKVNEDYHRYGGEGRGQPSIQYGSYYSYDKEYTRTTYTDVSFEVLGDYIEVDKTREVKPPAFPVNTDKCEDGYSSSDYVYRSANLRIYYDFIMESGGAFNMVIETDIKGINLGCKPIE